MTVLFSAKCLYVFVNRRETAFSNSKTNCHFIFISSFSLKASSLLTFRKTQNKIFYKDGQHSVHKLPGTIFFFYCLSSFLYQLSHADIKIYKNNHTLHTRMSIGKKKIRMGLQITFNIKAWPNYANNFSQKSLFIS